MPSHCHVTMNSEARYKGQLFVVASLIIAITTMHYLTHRDEAYQHIFFRELYFIPIMLAGFWFGFKGGISASLLITALYMPFVLLPDGDFSARSFENLMEILLFNLVGGVLGWLRDRENRIRRSSERWTVWRPWAGRSPALPMRNYLVIDPSYDVAMYVHMAMVFSQAGLVFILVIISVFKPWNKTGITW